VRTNLSVGEFDKIYVNDTIQLRVSACSTGAIFRLNILNDNVIQGSYVCPLLPHIYVYQVKRVTGYHRVAEL
jgi:hypothetical protein